MGYRRCIVVVRACTVRVRRERIGLQGQGSLFDEVPERAGVPPQPLRTGVWHLPRMADPVALAPLLERVLVQAPPRRMVTPGGHLMSVAMSNCGQHGWVSDRTGYRYQDTDPDSGERWPAMPHAFASLATRAAARCGFERFEPDVCLINRYRPGDRMGAHRDMDERDAGAPIVSVSLGIPARFFIIGPERRGRATAIDVRDGDVVVFGGPARLHYHGVRPVWPATNERYGACRWNLTFRRAV